MDKRIFTFENASLKPCAGDKIPERFFSSDISCSFSLAAAKDEFGWSGVPGELYFAEAPLNATAWGEEFRKAFSHWRCAVFAPDKMPLPHRIPIVFLFTGISGDYCDTAIWLPKLMQEGNCIVVAFDTHLTGIRNLLDPGCYAEDAFVGSLKKMERDDCVMRNAAFREMIEEMAFNVWQIRAFLTMRYGVDKDAPLYMMGFSLGGFYATQLALCLMDCKMCVAGGAAPDINLYSGLLFGTMRKLPEWFTALFRQIDAITEAKAVRRVTETPFDIAQPASPSLQVHYVIGEDDSIVSADCVKEYCDNKRVTGPVCVNPIPSVGHTPGGQGKLNQLGECMVDTLIRGIHL